MIITAAPIKDSEAVLSLQLVDSRTKPILPGVWQKNGPAEWSVDAPGLVELSTEGLSPFECRVTVKGNLANPLPVTVAVKATIDKLQGDGPQEMCGVTKLVFLPQSFLVALPAKVEWKAE